MQEKTEHKRVKRTRSKGMRKRNLKKKIPYTWPPSTKRRRERGNETNNLPRLNRVIEMEGTKNLPGSKKIKKRKGI